MPAVVAPVEKALPILPVRDPTPIRRLELADLSRHGIWLVARLLSAYPHLTQRELQGWLRGIVTSNEFLFLYQENSVALAQLIRNMTLTPKPIIYERFVFAEDKDNPAHIAQAAAFYGEIGRWAKTQSVENILVEEMTDVPHDQIKEYLGRLYTRQQVFARV